MGGVIETVLSLESFAIESNIPVRGVINQLEQAGNDGVQTIA